jgi:hypothetical protein
MVSDCMYTMVHECSERGVIQYLVSPAISPSCCVPYLEYGVQEESHCVPRCQTLNQVDPLERGQKRTKSLGVKQGSKRGGGGGGGGGTVGCG